MSSDPVYNGRAISELKVVELRKILDDFQLSKSGVKKELFERLRDYLNIHSDGGEQAEADTSSKLPTRASASPRKTASPVKSPTKAGSPVKSPPPPANKYVAQYLQNQQATLEEMKRTELLKTASENSVTQTTSVGPVIEVVPAAERDEVSSTVSNAGSDNAPQTVPSDASIVNERKAEEQAEKEDSGLGEIKSLNKQLVDDISVESTTESTIQALFKEEKAITVKSDSSNNDEKEQSKSPKKEAVEASIKLVSVEVIETVISTKEESGKKEVKHNESKDESAVELDYDEEESTDAVKIAEEKGSDENVENAEKEKSSTSVTAKKHRAIVFDLDNKSADKSDYVTTSRKTTISVRPTVTSKLPEQPSEYGSNSLGNVRVRPLSPARNEPTDCIHITQLKRPYVVSNLQSVLRSFGEFSEEDFWIDTLRSNCIVKYNSLESAQKARDELHNVKWPDNKAPMIAVDYTTEEKLLRQRADPSNRKSSSGVAVEKGGLIIHVSNERKLSTEKDDISEKSTESRKRKASPTLKSTKTLDELFKKTKAKPQVYYLPLTDEEVAAKKERRKH